MLVLIVAEAIAAMYVCYAMSRIAAADNRSPLAWGAITAALCLASVAVPVPFIRQVFAGYAAFGALFIRNLISLPPL
jgi:hypothetical protein